MKIDKKLAIIILVFIIGIIFISAIIISLNNLKNAEVKAKIKQEKAVAPVPKIAKKAPEPPKPKIPPQPPKEEVAVLPPEVFADQNGIEFKKGDTVKARQIKLSNGYIYKNARIENSVYSGVVYWGYIWPQAEDEAFISDCRTINPSVDPPDGIYHKERATSISNDTIPFDKGETAYGYKLIFSNGKIFYGAGVINSPYPGKVTQGVVWPEYKNSYIIGPDSNTVRIIDPKLDRPWPLRHRELATYIDPNDTLPFQKGDTVIGKKLEFSNGIVYENAGIKNSPYPGTVTDGIIWPSPDYFSGSTEDSVDFEAEYRLLTRSDLD